MAGVEAKISGDQSEGELLVRRASMFLRCASTLYHFELNVADRKLGRYLDDVDATRRSHDADGYFKTGDVVRKTEDGYSVLGRISVDSQFQD